MSFTLRVQYPDDTGATIVHNDTPNYTLRRVLRIWRRGEQQFHDISELVVRLRYSLLHFNDNSTNKHQRDALDEVLALYLRKHPLHEQHSRNDMADLVVVLRLSLMKTVWEKMGYLDLSYIDSVIRQTLQNFQNKHKKTIKQEYWAILAEMCWDDINHHARIEPDEEKDPVDIDITDDDIDAWINSELYDGTEA